MAVTRLKRKDRKNKARANNRIARIKQLNAMPVIKKIDTDEIKASFGTVAKKKPAAVQEEKTVEKVVAKEEVAVPEASTPEKEAKAEVEAPKEEKQDKQPSPKEEASEPVSQQTAPKDQEARVEELLKNIGTATEADKNDLKKINGIGPKYESFLNSVGIYTYQQVSKLSPADLDNLAEFSGLTREKIEKEDWMKQATQLLKS